MYIEASNFMELKNSWSFEFVNQKSYRPTFKPIWIYVCVWYEFTVVILFKCCFQKYQRLKIYYKGYVNI